MMARPGPALSAATPAPRKHGCGHRRFRHRRNGPGCRRLWPRRVRESEPRSPPERGGLTSAGAGGAASGYGVVFWASQYKRNKERKPVVLTGLELGTCTTKWTIDYLSQAEGSKEVKIHVSAVPQMDFLSKNFVYRTLPFDAFVRRAAEVKHKEYFLTEDEKYYLRSVGEDVRKDIADIRKQFPILAEDVHIPEYFEKEQFFSSVFRISSAGLQLWTHYDVMDNFLIQVTGRKRVVLYSPRDAPYLYLSGTKSEVLDVDNPDMEKYPLFVKAKRYECVLEAGDVLFIPALWFHNVISEEFGVALNVFWKHLPAESYDKTDTYGNKDPMAASRAIQILDRALKTLEELPEEYRDFYARRMVLRIQEKAYRNDCG